MSDVAPRARFDGSRILFEVRDGAVFVPCAISKAALEEISGTRRSKPGDLLGSFEAARPRIERMALAKFRAMPNGIAGRLNLWADDLSPPPPNEGASAAALVRNG